MVQRASTGEGEVEVEFGNLLGAEVLDFSPLQRADRHRRVQVIEKLQGSGEIENLIDDACSAGTIARTNHSIGLARDLQSRMTHALPVRIKVEFTKRAAQQI